MARFKYSYSSFVYGDEPIASSVERVARFGYDAIELMGFPERLADGPAIAEQAAAAGIVVGSVCAVASPEADLTHPDAAVRGRGIDYLRACAEFTASAGAAVMVVAPSASMKTRRLAPAADEHRWAVECLRVAGEHAASVGVEVVLECWNRYETYFLNRLEQALALWEETGLTAGGVMADTFHMNIEEPSIPDAIRAAGRALRHVHVADSNRAVPGTGHIDFEAVLSALVDIGYDGYVCFELLPAAADVIGAMRAGHNQDFLDRFTGEAIERMRELEAPLAGVAR